MTTTVSAPATSTAADAVGHDTGPDGLPVGLVEGLGVLPGPVLDALTRVLAEATRPVLHPDQLTGSTPAIPLSRGRDAVAAIVAVEHLTSYLHTIALDAHATTITVIATHELAADRADGHTPRLTAARGTARTLTSDEITTATGLPTGHVHARTRLTTAPTPVRAPLLAAMRAGTTTLTRATHTRDDTHHLPDDAAATVIATVLAPLRGHTRDGHPAPVGHRTFTSRLRRAVTRADTAHPDHAKACTDRLARRHAGDPRTLDQLRTDIALHLITHGWTTSSADSDQDLLIGTPPAATCHLTLPITTLLGTSHEPGELTGLGPVPAPIAAHIAMRDNSVWTRLLTDPTTGHLLDRATSTYHPTATMRADLHARDHTCRAPDCHTPATTCETDHVTPWNHHDPEHGGPTRLTNLAMLCKPHHQRKTHQHWRHQTDPHGHLTFTTTLGHTTTTSPYPYPPGHPHHDEHHEHDDHHDDDHDQTPHGEPSLAETAITAALTRTHLHTNDPTIPTPDTAAARHTHTTTPDSNHDDDPHDIEITWARITAELIRSCDEPQY